MFSAFQEKGDGFYFRSGDTYNNLIEMQISCLHFYALSSF